MNNLFETLKKIRQKKAEDYSTLADFDLDLSKTMLHMKNLIIQKLNTLDIDDYYELFYKNVGRDTFNGELHYTDLKDDYLENSRWKRKACLDNALDIFFDYMSIQPEVDGGGNLSRLLHSKIVRVAGKLFIDEYYKQAVYEACIEVENSVKQIHIDTGHQDLSGKPLMQQAFSESDDSQRSIKLTELVSKTDKEIQEGYRFLFTGFMMAIRNSKSHKSFTISREEAIHMLFIASHLMYTLDKRLLEISEINVQMPF